ncbi:MAG: hypothetical protein JWM33_1113 [Caulobacteraceae bacterium]|nr:hypothetical protein [Caulobacteraceae bacterium]
MTPTQTYLARETAISAVINTVLTAAFFFLVFHGQTAPMVWGARGLVVDCLPQGFMVGLMSVLPAMLITRKRAAGGGLNHVARRGKLPTGLWARAWSWPWPQRSGWPWSPPPWPGSPAFWRSRSRPR